jgi:hypothetical protein
MTFFNNSIPTIVEAWFIPFDILAIIILALAIILATTFLFIIVLDKIYYTVPMILNANICLAIIACSSNTLAMSIFTLQNDLHQIQYQDSLCIIRGYLSYATCAINCYSYVLPAFYRYMITMYPTRLFWQSARTQILLIGLSWMIAFVFPILYFFIGAIVYNVDNQICQVPFRLSFSIVYAPVCVYIIPLNMVIFLYYKLVRYVKEIGKRVTPANTLLRLQRELKMFRRAMILIMILLFCGFPYTSFIFLSFFNRAPKYHFRIAFLGFDFSLVAVMIAIFQFTDSLKESIKKLINGRPNTIAPTMT